MADTAKTRTVMVDGLPIETTDAGAQAIEKLQRDAKAAADAASTKATADATKIGELTASVSTKDGEIAALKKQLDDAKVTPQKLDAAVAARAKVIADAKAIAPNVVTDAKTDDEIRRAAVETKLGDTAKALDDAGILGAFTALVPTKDGRQADQLAQVLGDVRQVNDRTEAEKAWNQGVQHLRDAWKGPQKAA